MSGRVLAKIQGRPVTWDEEILSFTGGMQIDADGSWRAYGPNNSGLDLTRNAGAPGYWYGIATDAKGNPIVQGPGDPFPGMYVSTTRLQRKGFAPSDPRRYVNSEEVPYAVIPGHLITMVRPKVIGCLCIVTNIKTQFSVRAVCADSGPKTKAGEGSIKLAEMHGIRSNPRTGGTAEPIFRYDFFPGMPAVVNDEVFTLQASA